MTDTVLVYEVYGYTPYEGWHTFGIFSTQQKAIDYVNKLKVMHKGDWEEYDYNVHELDAHC